MKQNEPTFTTEIDENEYLNLSEVESAETKSKLISLLQTQLHRLTDLLEEIRIGGPGDQDGFLEKQQKDQSHQVLFEVMRTMRYLDYESLKKVYLVVDVGTSYREEPLRTLFLELLSQAGTKASITLLKDLIVSKAVKRDSAIQILKTVPFYVRHPNEELLQMYEGVLEIQYDDRVKQAATLSFATMVNRVCKSYNCPPEVLDKYIVKYLELFKDSSDYQWKLNYLEGLSNIKIGNVVNYLEPIIKGVQPYSHHIRFLAMWASHHTAILDAKRAFEVYWPILENKSEHLELRIGAFVILLLSKPSPDRFHSLASLMDEEPEGSHLYYFFYSSMESLSGTTHPCYQELKKPAQHILLYIRRPEKMPFWTGNHMFDYIERYYKFGSFMQAFMVADQKTSWPNVFYFLQHEHFLGHNYQMLSFYVKLQGVKKTLLNMFGSYSRDGEKFTQLQKILSKYGVDEMVEENESLHIELIVQYQDQAVMTYYYNETNIIELLGVIRKVGSDEDDFHVNYQHLMFPMINELTSPTDMGLPMSFKSQTPFLFSFRGNFTTNIMAQKSTRENQIDMKYWRQTESFLSVYNPVSKLWHGISRMHSTLVHIPLNFYVSADLESKNFKFSLSKNDFTVPGVAIHSGSVVFAKPSMAFEEDSQSTLSLSCPSCNPYTPIKGENYHEKLEYQNEELGKLKMNYVFRYFDCDVYDFPFTIDAAADQMLVHLNYRFLDGYLLLQPFQYYDAMMRLPLSGRCGFIAKITPEIDSKINNLSVIVQFTSDDFKNKAIIVTGEPHKEKYVIRGFISQESVDGVAEQLYDFSLVYQQSIELLHHYLRFKMSANDPSQDKVLKMCLDADLHYPDPPVDPLKQREPQNEAVDGSINAVFGMASHNRCPKAGVIFKVDLRATPVPDKNQECYRTCADDIESPEWDDSSTLTPYTPACLEAAIDSTQLRRFEFRTEVEQFIYDIGAKSLYALYIDEGTDAWGDYIISSNYSVDEYPIIKDGKGFVVEFAPNGFLIVDTIEDEERERMIFNYGLTSPYNSRFDDYKLAVNEENLIESCMVSPKLTYTLDGTQLSHEVSSCYTLAVGHCNYQNPLFAVMVRKIKETNKLALKVYSFRNYLEIIPGSNNSVELNVNGEHVYFDKENGYEIASGVSSFRVWQRQSKKEKNLPYIQISTQPSDILVDYGVDRVIVELSALYSGDLCGLCGDYFRPQTHHKWDNCDV